VGGVLICFCLHVVADVRFKCYLDEILAFISMHLSLVLILTSADYDSCPKVNLFHRIF